MANLPDAFSKFHGRIELGSTEMERMDSAWQTLATKLVEHYGLEAAAVFLQGSYPNGTAIRPDPDGEKGEYDVDLISVSASAEESPEGAIAELEESLRALGYGMRFEADSERPCVRLRYADDAVGRFHVDVVPARQATAAPLEIPRPKLGWKDSAPAEYVGWCRDQGEQFARTVQMLKRWRDHNQSARKAIKSIVLQVLAAECLFDDVHDGDRVAGTLKNISSYLEKHSVPPTILNPVLLSENLAERWTEDEYRDFKGIVSDAAKLAEEALKADEPEAHEKWRELFGSDFPPYEKKSLPIPKAPPPGARAVPQEAPSSSEWANTRT